MSLTAKLFHILFPDHLFLGTALGVSADAFAQQPDWEPEGDLAAEGVLQRVWAKEADGFLGGRASLSFSMGALCRAEAGFMVDDAILTMNEFGSGLASGLDKFATPHGDRVLKKRRYLASWDWAGDVPGILSLDVHPMEDEHAIAAEIRLDLAPGAVLPRRLCIDVDGLAELIATKAHPKEDCLKALNAFLSWNDVFTAYSQEPQAVELLSDVWERAAEDSVDLQASIRKLFHLVDWSSLALSGMMTVPHLIFWRVIAASPLMSPESDGTWIQVRLADLLTLIDLTGAAPSERAEIAYKIVAALQFGDAVAFDAIAQRIAQNRKNVAADRFELGFCSSPEIDARAFALVTAGLDDAARLRFAAAGLDDERRYAAALWCVGTRGLSVPTIQIPEGTPNAPTVEAWATFLALVRRAEPELFYELLGRALLSDNPPLCETAPCALEHALNLL